MSDLIQHITDADFAATTAQGVTVVDFWAPWCGPCRQIAPVLEELAAEFGDKIRIVKINIDDHNEVATQHGIMSIPTLLIFKDGKKVAAKVGGQPKAQMKKFIEEAL